LIIPSPFHGGDGGGDVGVGVAAAVIICPFLYMAIFSNILKNVKTELGRGLHMGSTCP